LSLEEIEAFRRSLKVCPKCNSSKGFWLTAKQDKSYVQCMHCGAILELAEHLSTEEASKKSSKSRRSFLNIKFKR